MQSEQSQSVKELAEALAKAQAEMKAADKNAMNPHFGKAYADLAGIIDAVRGPFAKFGLCFTQTKTFDKESRQWFVITTIRLGDQFISDPTPILTRGQTAQDFGAGLTYARRQGLQTLVGVAADEDDDGNAASGQPSGEKNGSRNQKQARQPDKKQEQPPADPNATITEAQAKSLMGLAKSKNWSAQMIPFVEKKYNVNRLGLLTNAQLAELTQTIQTKTADAAMAEVSPPHPGDFNYEGPVEPGTNG